MAQARMSVIAVNCLNTVLLDLDGTLVDSVPDIAVALDRMLAQWGRPGVGEAQTRQWVGNGAARLVERALTGELDGRLPEPMRERALMMFLAEYGRAVCEHSRLYPGVREGLDRLRADGYCLACVTNKPEGLARALLEALDLGTNWFPIVVGGDTTPARKPDPMPLHHAMRALGAEAQQTLMVGDSQIDVRAARHAGVTVACVPYGYNREGDIREAGADWVVENLLELHCQLRPAV